MTKHISHGVLILVALLAVVAGLAYAQELTNQDRTNTQASPIGTAFTYQAQLKLDGEPVSELCDFQFGLYDAAFSGNQTGITQTESITVADGLFVLDLDFGAVFTGTARWLGTAVRCGDEDSYTGLGRQELTAAPYAFYAMEAPWSGLTGDPPDFDDTVSWDEISGIVGDGTTEVAAGDHTHPGDDITSAVPTATLALSATQAPWSGLVGVPADIADGDDDTTYTNGFGLALDGVQFSVVTSTVQARVSEQCAVGSSIRAINADGTVECQMIGFAPANVIIVATSGGDFSSIQAALDSITDASADNPYLIRVAPGVYTETVTMKPYVDIEGAGEGITKITSSGGSIPYCSSATLAGATNTELRFLTVENTGGSTYAWGICNSGSAPRLTHVTATASGSPDNRGVLNAAGASPTMNNVTTSASGGSDSYGVYNASSSPIMNNVTAFALGGSANNGGVFNYDFSSPTMNDVTATASGGNNSYGVLNTGSSSPTMSNVTATASGGVNNYGMSNDSSWPVIHRSVISGTTYSIFNQNSSTVKIGLSQLVGDILGGGFSCVGVYTSTFTAFTDADCQ